MKYEIPDRIKSNLMEFLNRVEYKGFNEVAAIQEILFIFNNPIKESQPPHPIEGGDCKSSS